MTPIGLVVLSPFIGSVLLGIFYAISIKKGLIKEWVFAFFALIAPTISFLGALVLFISSIKYKTDYFGVVHFFRWIEVGDFNVSISFFLDPLSITMTLFVTFLTLLIHIYSIGYMKNDEGFGKFFSYMNLFLGFMLVLVLADNPILTFMGWEGVGACSYLLIAFYFTKSENARAGNKAFILNRIGDFGFLVGIITLYLAIGNLGFDYLSLSRNAHLLEHKELIFICLALFVGASGKSAQIPLYTWLPDAMAGPTPISALIHAATMVTAGVYMIVRFGFIYIHAQEVLYFIGVVGAISALFAAIIATKQNDIKKILAYSTISQLGYMFASFASGTFAASLFHLFMHGFFKALLFLSAGAVIVALLHEQNIFKMGNLKKIKIIYYPTLIGSLAIAGIFPLSGFFSKDKILIALLASENYLIFAILLFSAGLTSYYMFRMFFLVFHGRNIEHNYAKVPISMSIILVVLSLLSIFGAMFAGFVADISDFAHASSNIEYAVMISSTIVSLAGIFIAYKRFFRHSYEQSEARGFTKLVKNLFYIDEIYYAIFVRNLERLSSVFHDRLDQKFLHALVEKPSLALQNISAKATNITQNGKINSYMFYMLLSMSILVLIGIYK